MTDKEKVNGFELCANGEPCTGEKFMKCPFSPRNNAELNCGVTMARNALELQQAYFTLEHDWRMLKELLKEQEKEIDEISDEYIDLGREMAKQPKIVRCKDCKHCYFASNRIQSEQTFACGKHGIDVTPDWFCADGEQK